MSKVLNKPINKPVAIGGKLIDRWFINGNSFFQTKKLAESYIKKESEDG